MDYVHLCLDTVACKVEEANIASRLPSLEGITQQQREEDAKKCRREDAFLFDATFDRAGIPGGPIILDCAFHFLMKGSD